MRNEHDAEDIAQEVFVRICARVSEFDRSRDALSWAFGIAAYELMTQRRRVQRRREESDSELRRSVDDAIQQDDLLLREELSAALKKRGYPAESAADRQISAPGSGAVKLRAA